MSWRPAPGIRSTATLLYAAGALLGSLVMALGTYWTARHYLIEQRQSNAIRQAHVDASFVTDSLRTQGTQIGDVLSAAAPPADSLMVVQRAGRWYSTGISQAPANLPGGVREAVSRGDTAYAWTQNDGASTIVVGVPLPTVNAEFYEVVQTTQLATTLSTLRIVLFSFAVGATLVGAGLGAFASRRLVRPLDDIATVAAEIGAGSLASRLPPTSDPDLEGIVTSFNSMVDALDERIQRDARFAADVGHELRSPLMTLITSVDLLKRRRADLPASSQTALDLLCQEVTRFQHTLEDLLELGRLDAGVRTSEPAPVDAVELTRQTLRATLRDESLLQVTGEDHTVLVDKHAISRALINLLENADRHGEGTTAVGVTTNGNEVHLMVRDAGRGVPVADRERIFERFARGTSGSRGSRPGSGLGLSLVDEAARADHGRVWCTANDGPGMTFVIALPHRPDLDLDAGGPDDLA